MSYIIGNTAIKEWYPDYPREPYDLDILGNPTAFHTDQWIKSPLPGEEVHNIPPLWKERELAFSSTKGSVYLLPAHMLILKISHMHHNINWDKHMFDIQFLLSKGISKIVDEPLLVELKNHWVMVHGMVKKSNLKLKTEEFFDNAIQCPIPHDDIHEIVKQFRMPAYQYILMNDSTVEPSQRKWGGEPDPIKIAIVQEEVMVMAYERLNGRDYRTAYNWMLKKYIREHAPEWMFLWCIRNYKLLHKCPFDYVKKINNEVNL